MQEFVAGFKGVKRGCSWKHLVRKYPEFKICFCRKRIATGTLFSLRCLLIQDVSVQVIFRQDVFESPKRRQHLKLQGIIGAHAGACHKMKNTWCRVWRLQGNVFCPKAWLIKWHSFLRILTDCQRLHPHLQLQLLPHSFMYLLIDLLTVSYE